MAKTIGMCWTRQEKSKRTPCTGRDAPRQSQRLTSHPSYINDSSSCRHGHKLKFVDGVVCHGEYRKMYSLLSMRERKRREICLAQRILAACVDMDSLRENGIGDIVGNIDIVVDIVNILDVIRVFLQAKLKINFNDITHLTPSFPAQDEEIPVVTDTDKYKAVITILGEATQTGYE